MGKENSKKLKFGQVFWLGVAGVGSLLVLIAIVSSILGVSAPHPSDPVQNYDCGSVLSPLTSLSDSKISTDMVCKDVMAGKRGSVFWGTVLGWVFTVGGVVMFVRTIVRKKEVVKKVEEEDSR